LATKKATTRKKAPRQATKKAVKKAVKKARKQAPPADPREPRTPGAPAFQATLNDLRAALADLTPPVEPEAQDLVVAMIHFTFADGVSCALGQEAHHRLATSFVDRNEFRLTEAFEIEEMLRDLEIPGLFERCLAVRDSVAQIYNDRNAVDLAFLREATVTERNQFFARVPAITPPVAKFLVDLVSFEEILFSDRSTLRVQQRVGLDPKSAAVNEFVGELKPLVRPFGHVPLEIQPPTAGVPVAQPQLCPACILCRLGPPGRRKGG
jgi:hypothetical protein